MRIVLNGERREVTEPASVESAVQATGADAAGGGLAVAVDGDIVPRSEWRRTSLREDQRVEVVRAVQGG